MPTQEQKYAVSMAGEHYVAAVEVKSSSRKEWVVGAVVPPRSKQPWVFVHVPGDGASPRYFVLTASQLNGILAPLDATYRKQFQQKHGQPFIGKGVVKLKLAQAERYENEWSSIIKQVS